MSKGNLKVTVTATPASVKAAFTKEGNLFAEKGVVWKDTLICLQYKFCNLTKFWLLDSLYRDTRIAQ